MSFNLPHGWRPIFDYFSNTLKEIRQNPKGSLRFDLPYVKVSDIAEQYYCEQQVELKKIHGEVENEQAKTGTDAHEKLLEGSIKIDDEDAIRKIFSQKSITFREMRLVGKHNGVNVLGVTDYVHFEEGKPSLLLDYKFKRKVTVYDNELLQAGLYSYLLNKMGFDTSRLRYGIVAAESSLKGDPRLQRLPEFVYSKYPDKRSVNLTIDGRKISVVMIEFDTQRIVKDLDWALSFWMRQREPKPTKVKAKCIACSFKDVCQFSLAKTEG